MTLTSVMRLFHFVGMILLFGAGFTMHGIGTRLRRAATVEEARHWLGFARTTAPLFPVGGLLLLVTGLHLAGTIWSFTVPWVMAGYVTVALMLPMGAFIQRPRFMAMGKAAMTSPPGPLPVELRNAINDSLAWGFVYASLGAALGLLWVMTQRPATGVGAAAPVVVLFVLGFGMGGRVAARDRAAST
jgi:hypothetical protein